MARGIIISITILFLLIFSAVMLTLVIKVLYSRKKNTPKSIINEVVKAFVLSQGDRFVDLGAGDFRIVFTTAKIYKVEANGFEMAPLTYFFARLLKLIKFGFKSKVKVSHKNFFNVDLGQYNVIYINQQPSIVAQLLGKISRELSDQGRVFLYDTKFPETPYIKQHTLSNGVIMYEYAKRNFLEE